MRTVHSVFLRSPPNLLKEVVMVDDYSAKGRCLDILKFGYASGEKTTCRFSEAKIHTNYPQGEAKVIFIGFARLLLYFAWFIKRNVPQNAKGFGHILSDSMGSVILASMFS